MKLDLPGYLAIVFKDDRPMTLRLLEQLNTQYRQLVSTPLDRGGNIHDAFEEGVKLNAQALFPSNFHEHVSVIYSESGKSIRIRFSQILEATQTCDDNNWKITFDKDIVKNAIEAIESRDPQQVLNASKQIDNQVRRLRRAIASKGEIAPQEKLKSNDGHPIEAAYRTRPLTKKKAAKLLGRDGDTSSAVKWISNCIKDGTITAEKLNRQNFIFDIREFPKDSHAKLKASPGK